MATLFISDLHLSGQRPHIIELFTAFLNTRARDADALYILGDLFEAWIGDDFVPGELRGVIKALRGFSASNHQLYVMHGNRDFLLGEQFEVMTGCQLLPDPYLIDLYGTPTLLSHGDLLCSDDVEYQKFRSQVRDPSWQKAFLDKSVAQRQAFADQARQESQVQTRQKSLQIMDVNQDDVEQIFLQYDVSRLIHGHTHRPQTHTFTLSGKPVTRIVLGDWYEQGSVLTCSPQGCELGNLTATSEPPAKP